MIAKKKTFILSFIVALSLFCAQLSAVTLRKEYSGSRVRGVTKSVVAVLTGALAVWNGVGFVINSGLCLLAVDGVPRRFVCVNVIGQGIDVVLGVYLTYLIYRDACDEFEAASLEDQQVAVAARSGC